MGRFFRVGSALLFGIVLVSGAFFVRSFTTTESGNVAAVANAPLRQYQTVPDTDNDGVSDWEEEMRGTDKNTPDAPSASFASTTAATSTFEPKTATDKFAVDFFSKFLLKRASGDTLTEDEKQSVIRSGLASAARLNTNTLYTRADILITKDDDEFIAVREYGNAAGRILFEEGMMDAPSENETVILKRALESNDPSALSDLSPIEDAYRDMIVALRATPVPSIMVERHLAILNTLQAALDDVRAMKQVFDDPLVTLVHVKRYQDDAAGFVAAIRSVRKALETYNVTYEPSEWGIIFFTLDT